MEEEQNGLRSIERSKLSGAKSRRGRSSESGMRRGMSGSPRRGSGRGGKAGRYVILTVFLVAVAVFLSSTMFSTGSLAVTLLSADLTVDGVFSAIREPAHSADISYSVRGPYTETAEETVTNITRERQNVRASGTVTVYNAHSSGERLNLVNRTVFRRRTARFTGWSENR